MNTLPLLLALALPIVPGAEDEPVSLRSLWTQPLGPAYSRVAATPEVVVTQYSDEEHDWVVALDPEHGTLRWRHALGPVYRGHDGSEDGPVSTPVIGTELVYALGPRGELVALGREDGKPRWSTNLTTDFGAAEPEYGFATTPVLTGGILVVQAGGSEGRHLVGLDAATGEVAWSHGEGALDYQSPMLMELLGEPQLVVLGGNALIGLAPADGTELWRHAFGPNDSASMGSAGPIDDARFFVLVRGGVAVYEVVDEDGGLKCFEQMRTRELGGGYAKPVYHDGHLYGFRGSFLSCVELETGERKWKSRPPGGTGLVLIDDHLVVYGAEGNVVLVRATPEGYVEEHRVKALEHSGLAWPTTEGARIFVRNAQAVACLELSSGAAAGAAAVASSGGTDPFGAKLAGLAGKGELDGFLAAQDSLPIVEDDLVHFVLEQEASDVAIGGSMTGGMRVGEPLARVPGTNVFHRTFEIEPGARWEYQFQVDFDQVINDPRNPRTAPGDRGPVSEVVTASYELPAHLATSAEPSGRMEVLAWDSDALAASRELQVYLPAGYDESGERRYPLLLVHNGPDWIENGSLPSTLDHLAAQHQATSLVAVFVPALDNWWFEGGGSETVEYVDALASELVPLLSEKYRLTEKAIERGVLGHDSFGMTSALAVVRHPEVFGNALLLSVHLGDIAQYPLLEGLEESPPAGARFHVVWNRYEDLNPDRGVDFAADGRRLYAAIEASGCQVSGGEKLDAAGWTSRAAQVGEGLSSLFQAW